VRTTGVGPSDWLWKQGAGYYVEEARELQARPLLPDLRRLRDRRIAALFEAHGGLASESRVLEIGCGRSAWLPHLVRTFGCSVFGIDIEEYAAELARANLAGAGARGEILCRDAFALEPRDPLRESFDLVYSMGVLEHYDDVVERLAILRGYLRPGGRILTTVPNLQGVNWLLQRLADLRTLETHVIYDRRRLALIHEQAGFRTLASGYAGFCDAHLSSAAGARSAFRRRLHRRLCRMAGLCSEAWARLARGRATPELRILSPHVFYAGSRPGKGERS
jgi:2-polyprenyl-6-hydroxyphenyl methylase/3-demethylubiquinone-9 3-methyltransferase